MSVTAVPLPPIDRRVVGGLWFGLAMLALVGLVAAWYTTRSVELSPRAFLSRNAKQPGVVTLPSGVQYQVLRAGSGARPTTSDIALINYEGRFANGVVFDRGGPAPMPVGRTFPGFAEGLMQMPVGSKYRLWIPPELGLPEGGGPIPPNSMLIFDVELLMVMPQSALSSPAAQAPVAEAPQALPPAALPPAAALPPEAAAEPPSGVTVHSGEPPVSQPAQ